MQFRILHQNDFHQLHQCFIEAFSDYTIKMRPSEVEYQLRLKRIGMDYSLSGGAFGEEMMGFIVTGTGLFEGKKTAYNGGTGVIPSARKQQLAQRLYEHLFPIFIENGIEQCLLEVISDNTPAIRLYEKLGFEKTRKLSCFAFSQPKFEKLKSEVAIQISKVESPDWTKYQAMIGDSYVCWQNQALAVERDLEQEMILEVYHKTETIGFAIFNPQNGKISQIAVAEPYRNKKIGHNLLRAMHGLSANKRVSILNIDQADTQAISFFKNAGFTVAVEQFEMVKAL